MNILLYLRCRFIYVVNIFRRRLNEDSSSIFFFVIFKYECSLKTNKLFINFFPY